MNKLAEQILVDIIANELTLASTRVLVRDQNWKFPPDDGIYVVVGMVSEEVIGSDNSTVTTVSDDVPPVYGLKQLQQVVTRENIQIDIMSRSTESIHRRWEIFAAIASIYSIQKQEENYFKIFRVPESFVNTSDTEGGSNLNKFSMTIACHVWYRKEKVISSGDYYDDFTQRVDDEKTIGTAKGIIAFEITGNTII